MKRVIYTVGHSSRKLGQLAEILRGHNVRQLIDIRSIPGSRHNPQFNKRALQRKMPGYGIKYLHMQGLGGLRKPERDSINTGWRNMSFRGYADYMQTKEFKSALTELIKRSEKKQTAVMCAEGNPYRCHRSLLADALVVRGIKAIEISSPGGAGSEHKMTRFARVRGRKITYPEQG